MEKQFCHVFWSDKEANFSDIYMIVWLNSILSLRRQGGKLDFVGDKHTMNYLRRLGYLDYYDRCNDTMATEALQKHNINYKIFPAFAKFVALENYDNPCIVDNDLILWKNITKMLEENRALFTHYEISSRPTIWYPKKEDIGIREGYEFPSEWNFNLNAVNTSIIYLGNDELREYVSREAFNYMSGNTVKSLGKAEFIFVEQSLIPMCCKLFNIPISTVIDSYWNAYKGQFNLVDKKNKPNKEAWNNYYTYDNGSPVTHTWIAKKYMEEKLKYKIFMCCRGLEKIREMDKDAYSMCEDIPRFAPYVSMLEQHGSTKQLVKKKIATNQLFEKK